MIFLSLILLAWVSAKLFRALVERTIKHFVLRQLIPISFDAAAVVWIGWIAVYSAASAAPHHLCTNLNSLPSAFKAAGVAFVFFVYVGAFKSRHIT